MPLTNSERQERHRARQSELIERLQAEVIALRAEVERLRLEGAAKMPELTVTITSDVHGDRIFRRVGERGHVTHDGRKMRMAVWRSACVICGGAFEIMTPKSVSSIGESRSFTRTTCHEHRITPKERGKLNAHQTVEVRRSALAKIKCEKLGIAQ